MACGLIRPIRARSGEFIDRVMLSQGGWLADLVFNGSYGLYSASAA
jgi:hypothetical protein